MNDNFITNPIAIIKDSNYEQFFHQHFYPSFINFVLTKISLRTMNRLVRNDAVMSKKGIHPELIQYKTEFLETHEKIAKIFNANNQRFCNCINIAGGTLRAPVDTDDDFLMEVLNVRHRQSKDFYVPEEGEETFVHNHKRKFANIVVKDNNYKYVNENTNTIKYKLIVYLKNKDKSNKFITTKRFDCYPNDVNNVISDLTNQGLMINKVYFNGKPLNK